MTRLLQKGLLLSLVIAPILFLTLLSGCETLVDSPPLLKQSEYEKMIAGSFEADYIGTKACAEKCHKRYMYDLERSVHGEQVDIRGLPRVNCESCHGAGSLISDSPDKEKVKAEHETLIDIPSLPPQAKSLICLKCHTANSTFFLHNWNSSIHASSDITCLDCHKLHKGPQQKVSYEKLSELCFQCHRSVEAEFRLNSRHPVPEKKMFCSDCHNPMSGESRKLLKETSIKEVCTRCHGEKKGPFVYEHADLTEDCRNCHRPHGSINNNLLKVNEPFLCLQCHNGHRDKSRDALASPSMKQSFYTRCTDCHSMIHGTDMPSKKGKGTFIQ